MKISASDLEQSFRAMAPNDDTAALRFACVAMGAALSSIEAVEDAMVAAGGLRPARATTDRLAGLVLAAAMAQVEMVAHAQPPAAVTASADPTIV